MHQMLKVGITGGIGSGKSLVCQVFETLGIPVFYADTAAHHILEADPAVIAGVKALFGADIYDAAGRPDRKRIGSQVFGRPELLSRLNALTHPAVIAYGERWLQAQTTPYALKEAALFFESGSDSSMDVMVGVTAPEIRRIARVTQRDGISAEAVRERIARQMDEAEKMARCDYVLVNDDRQAIIPQVLHLHQLLLERSAGKPELPKK